MNSKKLSTLFTISRLRENSNKIQFIIPFGLQSNLIKLKGKKNKYQIKGKKHAKRAFTYVKMQTK